MPGSLSPFHISAVARSLSRSVESLLVELSRNELEPEFRYQYKEQSNLNREVFTILPTAMRLGHLTPTAKQTFLRRIVLRDHAALTQFFMAIIRSPASAFYVEELHCHVDLSQHTTADRFSNDIALLSELSHLDHCLISLDILISIREHTLKKVEGQFYRPASDLRFRQAIFLSLLGHLRNLKTLRMTVHGGAHQAFSWFNRELQFHYPRQLNDSVPCVNVCRSPTKITFCAADNYDPSAPWHPLTLWPLIDLPEIQELEIENNPNGCNGRDTPCLSDDDSEDGKSEGDNDIYESFTYLSTFRIKNYLPYPIILKRIFTSFKMLHTLEICGSVPSHGSSDALITAATNVNLNTLLQIPSVAKTLRYLSIDEDRPAPHSAEIRFGLGHTLSPGCLAGLTELRVLYIPSFALFGGMQASVDERTGGTTGVEAGQVTVQKGHEDGAVSLPPKLERLEIVEDPHGGAGEQGSAGHREGLSAGKTEGLMRGLATYCLYGRYSALKQIVLWCQGGASAWSPEAEEEVKGLFRKAGVGFARRHYEPWPKDKVGGWRLMKEEQDSGKRQ